MIECHVWLWGGESVKVTCANLAGIPQIGSTLLLDDEELSPKMKRLDEVFGIIEWEVKGITVHSDYVDVEVWPMNPEILTQMIYCFLSYGEYSDAVPLAQMEAKR